ncbi:MAG: imidazole glycerol phosphate synthase subunit HisH [Candidatus Omnitrophota bacterium]
MIAIIDYGMGNLGSVAKAFAAIGAEAKVTTRASDLERASKIVLPGVGAFKDAMKRLKELELLGPLALNIRAGKPYLGLCLGMQILFDRSAEGGATKGLGIIPGSVVRFKESKLKVPQIGWNRLSIRATACPLLKGIPDGSWMYFVHSFYVAPKSRAVIATTTDYGRDFASMIWSGNIYATQFHPEKSQAVGMKMLENFVTL